MDLFFTNYQKGIPKSIRDAFFCNFVFISKNILMKSLLKLAFFLVIAVVGYNYFFGTVEEKESSQKIVRKVRDVGRDAWGLLKSEKAKLKDGKYDGAVDKVSVAVKGVGELLGKLSKTAKELEDSGALDRLSELQQKQKELQAQLAEESPDDYNEVKSNQVKSDLKDLLQQTERLMKDMDAKE